MSPSEPDPAHRAAVIDVGSNSVRLVTYRIEGRSIWTVYNEKALAGLGRNLPKTGRLSRRGVETALKALHRFNQVLVGWRPETIYTAATAAVREAEDGDAFLERIHAETGLRIRRLSGREEARYAALGVIAGQPEARGVVGDLGGSSLELVRLEAQGPGDGATLALGPFALGAPGPLNLSEVRKRVDRRLQPAIERFQTDIFHAVGGAWRNLALFHMARTQYPLRIAHQFTLGRDEAIETARLIARQSKDSFANIEGLSKKRAETLPYAALVLEALLDQTPIERVVFSAYGVREGLLFDAMSAAERAHDPLIAGCVALAAWQGMADPLGPALDAWLEPVFAGLPPLFHDRDALLRAAAARLADLGARLHPDHRADLVFAQVLRAPLAGLSHVERVFLACAAFSRHTAATTVPEPAIVRRLLSREQLARARVLGAAIRLGCDLSARDGALLPHTTLSIAGGRLVLSADTAYANLLSGEQTAKRAAALAQGLGLKLKLGDVAEVAASVRR